MRVLILSQFFPPEAGAAPTRLASLVKALQKQGHEIEVVTAMPNYPQGKIFSDYRGSLYKNENSPGLSIHRFWLYAGEGKALRRLISYLSFAFMACFAVFTCRKPDLIFVNSGPLFVTIPAQLYSFFWHCPYIFNVADLWPRSVEHLQGLSGKIFLKLALWLEKVSYKRALYVNAVTEGIRNILITEKKLPPERVLFLPNGVDTEIFSPRVENSNLRQYLKLQNKKIVIYPGNHGYAHALDKVLEAASLLKNHPEVHFLFIGGGSEKSKLRSQAQEMRLENVSFLDPVPPEKLVDYIQMAEVGLIHVRNSPLAEETRPAKMFPMMAMAKPILYCGFGEGAKMLELTGGGIISEPENALQLKENLLYMLGQPEKLHLMGQSNRTFIKTNYEAEQLVKAWLSQVKI